jgi:hypothetical protein
MRIAFGLFGFLSELLNSEEIKNNIKNALPYCPDGIDIYYFCPTIIHESNESELDTDKIEKEYKNAGLGNVTFKWFKYNPFHFIKTCINLGLPIQAETQMYPYRSFSMYYNMKGTIELIKNSNINYDYIILTRNDYIKHIAKYEELFSENIHDGLYIWRKDGHAEDRVIFGNANMVLKLDNIYEELPTILNDLSLTYNEGILRYYINKTFDNSLLHIQKLQPLRQAPVNLEFKRSSEMQHIVLKYYKYYIELENNHSNISDNL